MLRALNQFFRQSFSRKLLFLRVSCLLLAVHAALKMLPFPRVYQSLKRFQQPPARPNNPAADVCWAVNRAGRLWFGDQGCLVNALVGETLLIRRGAAARMHIGVRKEDSGQMLAHAWVEVDGQTVIGGVSRLSPKTFQKLPQIQDLIG